MFVGSATDEKFFLMDRTNMSIVSTINCPESPYLEQGKVSMLSGGRLLVADFDDNVPIYKENTK